MPQAPRTPVQEKYLRRTLDTVSGIIRNCAFVWFYPPFEPRLWILYEVAEYILTCSGEFPLADDIQVYTDHVNEMIEDGVCKVLKKHNYRCTFEHDRIFLTSWLELLVLLRRNHIDMDISRRLMNSVTWHPRTEVVMMPTPNGILKFDRFGGVLTLNNIEQTFTPFSRFD